MDITYTTDIEVRAGRWYVVTRLAGADRPAAEIGPLPTEAMARDMQPRLHESTGRILAEAAAYIKQLGVPAPAPDPPPLVVESTPVSDGGWVMRRFMGKG